MSEPSRSTESRVIVIVLAVIGGIVLKCHHYDADAFIDVGWSVRRIGV